MGVTQGMTKVCGRKMLEELPEGLLILTGFRIQILDVENDHLVS